MGEEFDPSGIIVNVNYDDSSSEAVSFDELTFTGFSSEKAGKVVVTVHYHELSTTFKVTIIQTAI